MQGTAALSDINAITAAVRAYEAHWNVGDLDAMAKLYAPDVHWVNVRGMHWRGFAEVDRAHRIYFDLMFKGVHNDLIEIESWLRAVRKFNIDAALAAQEGCDEGRHSQAYL